MATKLGLYNDALTTHLGERRLASLTEDREPRHNLDAVYDAAVKFCLEEGNWDFAMRAVKIEKSAAVTPAFGYRFAFAKPVDWIRSFIISPSELLEPALVDKQITDEAGYWYADVDPLYVKYVSLDSAYGLDLARWPESFTNYVGCYLANKIVSPTTSSESKLDRLAKALKLLRSNALAKDAINAPVSFPPRGAWSRSRQAHFHQMGRE